MLVTMNVRYCCHISYRYVYPEFLPNADPRLRDRVAEMLQRRDMLRRRAVVDVPEFYVGEYGSIDATNTIQY